MWKLIKGFFSFYKNLTTLSLDRIPMVDVVGEKYVLNKDDSFTLVIRIDGVDYNGISEQEYLEYFKARESTVRKLSKYILSSYTLRFKERVTIDFDTVSDDIGNEVLKRWGNSFRSCFVNRHYLAITTKKMITEKIKIVKTEEVIEKLEETGDFVVSNLSKFGARIIEGDELRGFFASLMNAKSYQGVSGIKEPFQRYLLNTGIEFYESKNYFRYLDNDKIASFITIKNLPEWIDQGIYDGLLERNIEMIISQHVISLPNDKSIASVKSKLNFNQGLGPKFNTIIVDELTAVLEMLTANKANLSDHCVSIQVISEDLETHKQNLIEVESFLSNNNMTVTNNTLNKEPIYFSQFPTKYESNVRRRRVNTENVTESISFSSAGIGNKRCTWGEKPVCRMTTVDGNIYNMIFHVNEEPMAKGHSLFIGGTGVGKSTVITFLLTCCRAFEGMKIVAFDRLKGLEISTRMQQGTYIDFNQNGINPLLLSDNQANKSFLVEFFAEMLEADTDDKVTIEKKIAQIFDWEKESRHIDEISYLFGTEGDRLVRKLQSWQTGGIYESYFTAKDNTFNLDNELTVFDFTDILENPKVLGLMTSYLTNMFFSQADGSPRIVFIDEFRNYLNSNIVANSLLKRLIEEFRKLNGVFIAAVQTIDQLWENDIGKSSLANFSKFFLFPVEGGMNVEAYREGLGLNDEEISWLENTSPYERQIMIKTNGGSSTVVNLDLKYLGKDYLNIYNSSSINVNLLSELRLKNPQGFRKDYLSLMAG